MSKLPDTWAQVPISEVAEVNPRKSVDLNGDDLVSFVPMAAVDEVSGTIAAPIDRPYSEVSKGFTHFRDEDVIFAKITPSMENGKSAVARDLTNGTGMGSTEFHVFRSYGAIEPEYLWRYVRQQSFRNDAQTVMSGAVGQQRVPADWLKEHMIPLAPMAQQRRIIEKVDSLTASTARARKELDRIPTLIARYKQRLLALAFAGQLTAGWRDSQRLAPEWSELPIGELVQNIVAGKNLRCEERPPLKNERGVVKVSAVTWGEFDPAEAKTLPASFDPPEKTRISNGDFLISRANTLELVAAVVIVKDTPPNLFLSDKILRLDLPDGEKPWLLWFLRSPQGRAAIEARATGNQLSMRNLSQKNLLSIEMPWPSEPERKEIVRRIESAFRWIDRLANEHASAEILLPKLEGAILARAFRGELVPQDPNDEPANVLLERIRAVRVNAAKKPRSKRGRPRTQVVRPEIVESDGTIFLPTIEDSNPTKPRKSVMPKSRRDDDVWQQPYLASKLKELRSADVQALFRAADLPVADFYKQLAWEIDNKHIVDSADELKAA